MTHSTGAQEADSSGGERRRAGYHESRGDLFDDDETSAAPSVSWLLGRGRAVVVTVDCADEAEAARIARALLESGLAATANHAPTATAWRQHGEIRSRVASTLAIKTVAGNVRALCEAIEETHSDEAPAIWVTAAYVGSAVRSHLIREFSLPADNAGTASTALGVAGSQPAEGSQLDAAEAMELAVAETRAVRRERTRELAGPDEYAAGSGEPQ